MDTTTPVVERSGVTYRHSYQKLNIGSRPKQKIPFKIERMHRHVEQWVVGIGLVVFLIWLAAEFFTSTT